MAMEGILKNRNGKLYVLNTYNDFSEPLQILSWWRVLETRSSGYGERPETGDVAVYSGAGEWKTRNPTTQRATGFVSIGTGSTNAETERVSINPPPAGGKELRWRDGRWEKLMTKGWMPAGEGKSKVRASKKSTVNHSTVRRHRALKKSPAQLDREIAEALKPHQGRYDDRPDAWQNGYDFARESAHHETRAEQREILQRVAPGARSAYDRGFVAAYQDMLGIPRSSSTGRARAPRQHATMEVEGPPAVGWTKFHKRVHGYPISFYKTSHGQYEMFRRPSDFLVKYAAAVGNIGKIDPIEKIGVYPTVDQALSSVADHNRMRR